MVKQKRLKFAIIGILFVVGIVIYYYIPPVSRPANRSQRVLASLQSSGEVLHFAGTLQPLTTDVITSPVDAVVEEIRFHYGDYVTQGQLLFSLTSEKFQTDYKLALTQYVKSKTDYFAAQASWQESRFLYQNKLISRDELNSKKLNYLNSRFGFYQAKQALGQILQRLSVDQAKSYELNIDDTDKLLNALNLKAAATHLQVRAPKSGFILLPNKEDNMDVKRVTRGMLLKEGDVLGMISDMKNLIVKIYVSEFNINQLHVGQAVTVTGPAFPTFALNGEVIGFDRQAQPNQGGLPAFPVEVAIKHLTAQQQQLIHAGMSAEVEIHLAKQPKLMIPLRAVLVEHGQSYVVVENQNNHQVKKIRITTGMTTQEGVEVLDQLQEGDVLLVTDVA